MAEHPLVTKLRGHRRIAVDTSIFIYQFEAHARYSPATTHVFHWIENRGHTAVTSTVTLMELLVQPYRLGDEERVDEFYGSVSTFPNLEWIPATLPIADIAARFRAQYNLRAPDALQAATAEYAMATAFVTNDRDFKKLTAFEVLILEDWL